MYLTKLNMKAIYHIIIYQVNGSKFSKWIKIYFFSIAQRNTKLLHFYSNFDERCKILGYVLKAMAKECSIADASRGSISSYGYILLLIHYLQRVKGLWSLLLTIKGFQNDAKSSLSDWPKSSSFLFDWLRELSSQNQFENP